MDKYDYEFLGMIIVMIVIVVGFFYGLAWWASGVSIGTTYRTVGTIELYEHSSFCGEHTWVVLKTVGGVSASFTLVGYHEFELQEVYDIQTVSVRGGYGGLYQWLRVVEINEG